MAVTPWMTSDSLIQSVSRKIAVPISQNSFSNEDILAFASEEMFISQVPSVLEFHSEYFVWTIDVPLVLNKTRYSVPDRAIGMKLRDLFYKDESGTLFEMSCIAEEDKAAFQLRTQGSFQAYPRYYLEGNDVVLAQQDVTNPIGSLSFSFFLRPNVLVPNNRAAIIESFSKTVTILNSGITAGDIFTINLTDFEAVAAGATGNQFNIGVSSLATAANLSASITTSGVVSSSSVGSPASTTVTIYYSNLRDNTFSVTQVSNGLTLQDGQGIKFISVPEHIIGSSVVDLLQTKSGHSMRAYGIGLASNAVSGTTINFAVDEVPLTVVVGDYLCVENECIIPQIPTDLHSGLAERTCARILASLGDQAGLAASNAKILEIDQRQAALLTNRVEGSVIKIRPRNSLLSRGKFSGRW